MKKLYPHSYIDGSRLSLIEAQNAMLVKSQYVQKFFPAVSQAVTSIPDKQEMRL